MDVTTLLRTFGSSSAEEVAAIVEKHDSLRTEMSLTTAQRTGVHCPVIQEEITAKCMVTGCSFYTDMPFHHNCALVYANIQGENFSTKDIAIIYRQPHSQVKSTVDMTLNALRSMVKGEAEPTHGFFPLAGVCVTCESPIEEEPLSIDGCEYCSSRCAARLSPAKAKQGYIPS